MVQDPQTPKTQEKTGSERLQSQRRRVDSQGRSARIDRDTLTWAHPGHGVELQENTPNRSKSFLCARKWGVCFKPMWMFPCRCYWMPTHPGSTVIQRKGCLPSGAVYELPHEIRVLKCIACFLNLGIPVTSLHLSIACRSSDWTTGRMKS